eukprot:115025-Pelagomonas_calceolata.AAC.3
MQSHVVVWPQCKATMHPDPGPGAKPQRCTRLQCILIQARCKATMQCGHSARPQCGVQGHSASSFRPNAKPQCSVATAQGHSAVCKATALSDPGPSAKPQCSVQGHSAS